MPKLPTMGCSDGTRTLREMAERDRQPEEEEDLSGAPTRTRTETAQQQHAADGAPRRR